MPRLMIYFFWPYMALCYCFTSHVVEGLIVWKNKVFLYLVDMVVACSDGICCHFISWGRNTFNFLINALFGYNITFSIWAWGGASLVQGFLLHFEWCMVSSMYWTAHRNSETERLNCLDSVFWDRVFIVFYDACHYDFS